MAPSQPEFEQSAPPRAPVTSTDPGFAELLAGSYARLTGLPLAPADIPAAEQAAWLYERAPFALLAHDTSPEPRFIYANRVAQSVFEYGWNEFIGMPSRLSAEAANREERQRLFDAVAQTGFQRNYHGRRIASSGRRFWIEDGVIWQLCDASGQLHGEAAMVPKWTDLPSEDTLDRRD